MCNSNASWIEEATEVVAEGIGLDWTRYRAAVVPMLESWDRQPDDEGSVPAFYAGSRYGRFDRPTENNGSYLPSDAESMLAGVLEIRARFHRGDWETMAERYLRIFHGAIGARVSAPSLDQSSWGIMVAAYGQDWLDMTGADPATVEREDWTGEFLGWLRGDVWELELQTTDDGETWRPDYDEPGPVIYGHADLGQCEQWAHEYWPDHFLTEPTVGTEPAAEVAR